MTRFCDIDFSYFQILILCLGVVIYGAFGSPTPDSFGVVEAFVGVALICSIGLGGVLFIFDFQREQPLWAQVGRVFLVLGFSVPVLTGVFAGHGVGFIVRDLIAFLFLLLPLFLFPLFQKFTSSSMPSGFRGEQYFLLAFLALGVLFALRSSIQLPFLAMGQDGESDQEVLFYLANMPCVLFAALFFTLISVEIFMRDFNVRAVFKGVVLGVLALVCLWPLVEAQQRASVGVFILLLGVFMMVQLWLRPRRFFVVLLVMLLFSFIFYGYIFDVLFDLGRKNSLVGFNRREAEWAAVWEVISAHPFSFLFGAGWGASFSSPAVGDMDVHFTHGLFSTMLLKMGIIGVIISFGYLWFLIQNLADVKLKNSQGLVLAMALAGPFFIDVFLYASFKSFDFGLLIVLITLSSDFDLSRDRDSNYNTN